MSTVTTEQIPSAHEPARDMSVERRENRPRKADHLDAAMANRWGDSVARALLGLVALGLLAGAALSSTIHLSTWLAAPFLIFGLIFTVLCAFYRDIDGRISYRMLSVRFSGPQRGPKRPN